MNTYSIQGSSWSFQKGRSFATISGCQGEVLVQILDFPILSLHFHFSLSSRQGELSQLRETFSPKSPSKMTPEHMFLWRNKKNISIFFFGRRNLFLELCYCCNMFIIYLENSP